MQNPAYEILSEEDLSQFNRGRGLQITYDRSPELIYRLPDTDLNFYSHEPSFGDHLHPFRPSGSFLVEAFLDGGRKFFSGRKEDFSGLDRKLEDAVRSLDSPEYYKEIKSFSGQT
ncbi:hypothetical protein AQV86_00080 [Nanohaloarchaea archaeon SG9]|nr:hypothetical protein AQV86_00080 [Nanohaloarchaea archaeon SG9]